MIELYGVFYKLITTNYYNCLCCQLPDKSLVFKMQFHNFQLFKMYDSSFKSSKLRIFYISPILTAYNTVLYTISEIYL